MPNIYDVSKLEQELEAIAQQNDGEIPEEKLQALVIAQTTALSKIESLCNYIETLESFQDACKKEEERILKQRKRAENIVANIKRYMTPYVSTTGRVVAGTHVLSIRESTAVDITDESLIPQEYRITKTVTNISKEAIRNALKLGEVIPGAGLVINKNLQIK